MQQLWRYYLGCGRGHSSDTTAERALEKGGEKKGKGGGENQCPIYRSKFWIRHCRSISGVVQPFDSAHRLQILYGSRVNSDTQLIIRAASVEPQMAWRAVNARHSPLDI